MLIVPVVRELFGGKSGVIGKRRAMVFYEEARTAEFVRDAMVSLGFDARACIQESELADSMANDKADIVVFGVGRTGVHFAPFEIIADVESPPSVILLNNNSKLLIDTLIALATHCGVQIVGVLPLPDKTDDFTRLLEQVVAGPEDPDGSIYFLD